MDSARKGAGSIVSGDEDSLGRKATHLGRKYIQEVFKQYSLHQIDCVTASQMLRCKADQLDTLESYAFMESSERSAS